MSLQVGDVLEERYRIVIVVKSGSMGAVFGACDTRLDGLCAVKEMHAMRQALLRAPAAAPPRRNWALLVVPAALVGAALVAVWFHH